MPPPGDPSPVGRGVAGYRRVLGRRRFAWFFLSQSTGDAGYAVYAIAVPWLALRTSGSYAIAGLVLGVEFGVYGLSFLAGPVVDRAKDLRTILLLGYPAQGALAFLMAYLAATDALTVPVLLVLVVAISGIWDFTWTASNAIAPKIVEPDELFAANALLSAVSGGNQLAGYAAGATAILLVGPQAGLALYGALNLVAMLLSVPVRVPQPGRPSAGWSSGLAEGLRAFFARGGRPLVPLASLSAVEAFFSATPALLILAEANLGGAGGARTYGVLFTAFALGGITGSILLGGSNPRARLGALLLLATAAEGGAIAAAVLAAPLGAFAAPLWFVVGGLDVVFYQGTLVYLEATSPPALVGRTLTNHYLFRGTGRALGGVAFGVVLTAIALRPTGALDGTALVAVALVGAAALPAIRRLRF